MNSEREREADDCDESELLELRLPDVKTTAGGGTAPPVYYWHKGQEEAAAQPKRRSRSLLPVSAASSKAIRFLLFFLFFSFFNYFFSFCSPSRYYCLLLLLFETRCPLTKSCSPTL